MARSKSTKEAINSSTERKPSGPERKPADTERNTIFDRAPANSNASAALDADRNAGTHGTQNPHSPEAGTTGRRQTLVVGASELSAHAPANDTGADLTRVSSALLRATTTLSPETAKVLGQLVVALEQISEGGHTALPFCDSGIVDAGSGSSTESEEPMFKWVATKPEPHRSKFRVAVMTLDGKHVRRSFETEHDAREFIEESGTKTLGSKGHKIEAVVDDYLSTRTDLKASTIETLRFRMAAIIKGRTHFPIEVFPWGKAWNERVACQATDSQIGIRNALQGLLGWALKQRILRRLPELPEVTGRRHRGKDQLRIDEAKRVVVLVLNKGDPLAIAIVSMLLTGIRPGEAMALKVRDLDDEGTVLWVAAEDGKTDAAKRMVEVVPALRPMLTALAQGRSGDEYLFRFQSKKQKTTNPLKSRTDALHRRLRQLCREARVPSVVPHSLRGLHSTIATERGSTGRAVADALGHTSFERITEPHYLAPGTAERANARRVQKVLEPVVSRAGALGGEVASKFTSPPEKGANPPTASQA